jgi:peptidoglycan/xylan/chitin deacetylase (PgdA/CDA1 family)
MSVLFYHRVADENPNPWTISVNEFERHLNYCRDHYDLIGLDEVQRRSSELDSYRPSVTFTFDDGYADNCRHALPLLIRHRVPCVYFVSVRNVRDQVSFPHDISAGIPLPVNTVDELVAAAEGGIEIGLHTHSHFDFSQPFDRATLLCEIVDAKHELEDLIKRPVRYFAFPYGLPKHLQPEAIQTVYDAGMLGFCSAFGAYNLPGQDTFHIRRIHGDPEFARLMNWLTFDTRKVRNEPIVPYTLSTAEQPLNLEPEHVV